MRNIYVIKTALKDGINRIDDDKLIEEMENKGFIAAAGKSVTYQVTDNNLIMFIECKAEPDTAAARRSKAKQLIESKTR